MGGKRHLFILFCILCLFIYFFSPATCEVLSETQPIEAEMAEGKEARRES